MKPTNICKKKHLEDDFIDSDGQEVKSYEEDSDADSIDSSECSSSENEEDLLTKYNLKDMKKSQSFQNPADNLLSDPKYHGKKAVIKDLELPKIYNESEFSDFADVFSTEDGVDSAQESEESSSDYVETENSSRGSIFKKFKAFQNTVSTDSIVVPEFVSTRNDDLEKANHLRNQLMLLDDLYTLRIMLQKLFTSVQPQSSEYVSMVLEMLTTLLEINELDSSFSVKKRKFSDLDELWQYIKELHLSKEPGLLSSYDSWWSKSHISSSKNDSSQRKLQILNQGFSASIVHAMKSFTPTLSVSSSDEDAKFYQQLLKDIIDAKLSSSKNASIAQLSIMADIRNESQIKKPTTSSKGRKLSYEVHPKLDNFMAQEPFRSTWSEEKINQFFNSLPAISL